MRRLKHIAAVLCIAVAAVALLLALVAAFPAGRNELAALGLRFFIWQAGYRFSSGNVKLASDGVHISGLRITDRRGELFFTARAVVLDLDPSGLLGRSDRRFGLRRVVLEAPHAFLIRHEDGTWNFKPLIPRAHPHPGAAKMPGGPAWRVAVTVVDGGILTVLDPQAVVAVGKTFSIDAIQMRLSLDQRAQSFGTLSAMLRTQRGDVPLRARLFSDDAVGLGQATLDAANVPIAPIVDAFAPMTFFVVEGGTANVHMLAYTVGSPRAQAPWHLSGDAMVRIARLRIAPLAVPVRDVTGALHYQDGLLSAQAAAGDVAGVPLQASGTVQILGPIRLAIGATQQGGLENARALFQFSKNEPVRGAYAATIRINGPLSDLRIAGSFRVHDAAYGNAALPEVNGSLYYDQGNLTIVALDLDHLGARVWASGDFDLNRRDVGTTLLVQGSAPARTLPFVANVADNGTLYLLSTVRGSLEAFEVRGYAQLTDGAATAQTFFSADPDTIFFGPAVVRSPGGEAFLAARIAHARGQPRAVSGLLVASRAGLHVRGGRVSFQDVRGFAAWLPSLDTTLDGVAVAEGSPGLPTVAVDARATGLTMDGVGIGDAALRAGGSNGLLHIVRASVRGAALTANMHGDLLLTPSLTVQGGMVAGNGRVDLAALAPLVARARPQGEANGTFSAALLGSGGVFEMRMRSSDARVAGLAVREGSLAFAEDGSTTSLLAHVDAPNVPLWAAGNVVAGPSSASASGHLEAFSPHLELSSIPGFTGRFKNSSAVGFAALDGTLSRPRIRAAAAVRTAYDNSPLALDVDVSYAATTLRSNESRIAFDGNRASVNGSIAKLGANAPASVLALDVNVRNGDLAGLDRYVGRDAPLTGAFDADIRVAGSAAAPQLAGSIVSSLGTIRGVIFSELRGRMSANAQSLVLQDASVELGSSRFVLDGDVSRRAFALRAASPRVEMSDFNDFFGGKDVFAGRGNFHVDARSSAGAVAWAGDFLLDDAALYDYQLGHIDAAFTSSHSALDAVVNQNGPAGAATVSGTARFRPNPSHLPDLASATYQLKARLHDVDVSAALPLVHQESLGMVGRLDADATMSGTLRKPVGNATFSLSGGRLRRIEIQTLRGSLVSDAQGVTLARGDLAFPYLTASASGRYTFKDEGIKGTAAFSAADLAGFSRLLRLPGELGGSATAFMTVSGTMKHPLAALTLDAGQATLYGMAFDRANVHATYAPGAVSIGDSELTLAGNHGTLTLAGELPLQLQPLALGPKDRPVDLSMRAEKIDLSAFEPIVGRYASLTGTLNATASITGPAGDPQGKGAAQIRNASVHSPLQAVPLQSINADVSFEQDTITLRELSGKAGAGSFAVRGSAHIVPAAGLRSNAGLQFSAHTQLHRAEVDAPGWIRGTLDGDLSVTRSGFVPYVEGSLALSNATIPFSALYDLATGSAAITAATAPQQAPGVPKLLPGHTIVYGGGAWGNKTQVLTSSLAPTPAPTGFALPPLDVNVALTAGNGVHIRGSGNTIDLTTAGGVVVSGSANAPRLEGQFYAVRGQVGYFDTNFRLVSGIVTFDPESGLLPTMDVVAVTNKGDAEITLHITGRVDNLNTELTANPAMTREQIVATLLNAPQLATQPTPGATPAAKAQSTLVQTAQSYFNAQLSRSLLYPFESALAQQLNIELLSLIFNAQGQLAIELRTRVSPTISAVYQTTVEVPVTQSYGVSYRLRDYLALDLVEAYPNLSLSSTNTGTLTLRYQFH